VASPTSLRIHETFVSFQGEGILTGVPSSFVRVSGCNLRCIWCDTPASSWAPSGERMSLDALVAFCREGPRHVVLTGGEPLIFPEVAELSRRLGQAGHHVTIETAATTWHDDLHCDLMSLSPKLAHSTPTARLRLWADRHERRRWRPDIVRRLMDFPWQLKFVVRARADDLLEEDLFEVQSMVEDLDVTDADRSRVLLMPECTDPARLGAQYARISAACRDRGFRVGPRMHLTAFGHTAGT
jgi:7-carboxy-7-deazaguanine synthase